MEYLEIMDNLSHEFLLNRMKRELNQIHDPEELRRCILSLVDLAERQKAVFRHMLVDMLDDSEE